MQSTVTVAIKGKKRVNAKYVSTFSQLPGRTFGPYDFVEMARDLTVSALLSPMAARDLVLAAHENGSASAPTDR